MKFDEAILRELYEVQGLSSRVIAKQFSVDTNTVLKYMRRFGIKVRPNSFHTDPKKANLAAVRVCECGRTFKGPSFFMHRTSCHLMPNVVTLRKLYVEEDQSLNEIAKMYSTDAKTILNLLRHDGIPSKPRGGGIAYRGEEIPSKETLSRMIYEEYLSYKKMGEVLGISEFAVRYWAKRHGIPIREKRLGHLKGKLPTFPGRDELISLYRNTTLDEIADQFDTSRATVAKLFKSLKIPIRPDGFNGGERFYCLNGLPVRSSLEVKVGDWLIENNVDFVYEPRLPFNRRCRADFLANGWYIEIWGMNDRPYYMERRRRKEAFYATSGASLIGIERWNFNKDRDAWVRKLRQCLQPASNYLPLFNRE